MAKSPVRNLRPDPRAFRDRVISMWRHWTATLEGFAECRRQSDDRRAPKLVITKADRRRVGYISMSFERRLLMPLGALGELSDGVRDFNYSLWEASAYLAPSDLASKDAIALVEENRKLIGHDFLRFLEGDAAKSIWTKRRSRIGSPCESIEFATERSRCSDADWAHGFLYCSFLIKLMHVVLKKGDNAESSEWNFRH